MARPFYLSLLLATVTMTALPVRAQEGVSAGTAAVTDPYYSRRAAARQQAARSIDAAVSRADYNHAGASLPAILTADRASRPTPADGSAWTPEPDASLHGETETFGGNYADASTGDTCGSDACGSGGFAGGGCGVGGCNDCDGGCGFVDPGFGSCGDPCMSGCRMWGSFDYLYWQVRGDGIPPLVTTSPIGTPQEDAGVLGEPDTRVLFGNQRLNDVGRSGGRIQLGYWLDEGYTAIEGHFYGLLTATETFAASSTFSELSNDPQILARPFNNVVLDTNDSLVLAYPNFVVGGVEVALNGQVDVRESSNVQSAGIMLRQLWKCSPARNHKLYMVGGYRFFTLNEDLQINHAISPVGSIFLPGTRFASHDRFATNNLFNGVDVGLVNEVRLWRFTVESLLKVALGNMHQSLTIAGSSSTFNGIETSTREGGLLALPTNIGHYNRDRFAVIPEVGVKLGFDVTPAIRATVGYNFTYVSRVMRPGNQLDLTLNTSQRSGELVGPPRPLPVLTSTDVFLQGITGGVEFRY